MSAAARITHLCLDYNMLRAWAWSQGANAQSLQHVLDVWYPSWGGHVCIQTGAHISFYMKAWLRFYKCRIVLPTPTPTACRAKYLCAFKQLRIGCTPKPRFYSNAQIPWQTGDPPSSPPTHSARDHHCVLTGPLRVCEDTVWWWVQGRTSKHQGQVVSHYGSNFSSLIHYQP